MHDFHLIFLHTVRRTRHTVTVNIFPFDVRQIEGHNATTKWLSFFFSLNSIKIMNIWIIWYVLCMHTRTYTRPSTMRSPLKIKSALESYFMEPLNNQDKRFTFTISLSLSFFSSSYFYCIGNEKLCHVSCFCHHRHISHPPIHYAGWFLERKAQAYVFIYLFCLFFFFAFYFLASPCWICTVWMGVYEYVWVK